MTKLTDEDGVVLALITRYEKYRLPRLMDIKARVDSGKPLLEHEIDYLEEVMTDATKNRDMVNRHPEWTNFCNHIITVYKDITTKALDNENT